MEYKWEVDIGAVYIKVTAPNIIVAIKKAVKKSKMQLSSVWRVRIID